MIVHLIFHKHKASYLWIKDWFVGSQLKRIDCFLTFKNKQGTKGKLRNLVAWFHNETQDPQKGITQYKSALEPVYFHNPAVIIF